MYIVIMKCLCICVCVCVCVVMKRRGPVYKVGLS